MSNIHDKLITLSGGEKSNWQAKTEDRQSNRKWLRYSSNIARRILVAINDIDGLNQKKLAGQLSISQQRISKILKGQENLTLETIAKLSEALGTELISFPEYKYSAPVQSRTYFVPSATLKGTETPVFRLQCEFDKKQINKAIAETTYANAS